MTAASSDSSTRIRTHWIRFRTTPEERASLHRLAKAQGMTLAEAMRMGLTHVLLSDNEKQEVARP